MHRYTLILFSALFSALVLFAGFNALIDPFGITGAPDIPGVTARETRTYEDGGRVHVGDQLLRGGQTSILLGSSRVVDGFPHPPENWPGGLYNAGMRGTNMYELTRAMVLAARDPALKCVVVGLDPDEFGTHGKAKATYWLSALVDGHRDLALARVLLSPSTFGASLQTLADNLGGGSARRPWQDLYEPGVQQGRFESGTRGIYGYYQSYQYDTERVAFFEAALEALTQDGVQVIGFIHPIHAWRENVIFRADRQDDYFQFRRDLTDVFARHAQAEPVQGCVEGGAAVLFDFSGFQSPATVASPGQPGRVLHPTFYEPSHYLPHIGQAMVDVMAGETASTQAEDRSNFGHRLTPQTVEESEVAIRDRRAAWLVTPNGAQADAFVDAVIESGLPAERTAPQFLNDEDWRELRSELSRIAPASDRR